MAHFGFDCALKKRIAYLCVHCSTLISQMFQSLSGIVVTHFLLMSLKYLWDVGNTQGSSGAGPLERVALVGGAGASEEVDGGGAD